MIKIFILCSAFFSSLTFASALGKNYEVNLKVFMAGKLVSQPRFLLVSGKKAEVVDVKKNTGKGHFVEVTVHPVPDLADHAFLQLAIGNIVNGKKTLVGTPQLSAMLREEASIEVEENGNQIFRVLATVTPARRSKNSPEKAKKR